MSVDIAELPFFEDCKAKSQEFAALGAPKFGRWGYSSDERQWLADSDDEIDELSWVLRYEASRRLSGEDSIRVSSAYALAEFVYKGQKIGPKSYIGIVSRIGLHCIRDCQYKEVNVALGGILYGMAKRSPERVMDAYYSHTGQPGSALHEKSVLRSYAVDAISHWYGSEAGALSIRDALSYENVIAGNAGLSLRETTPERAIASKIIDIYRLRSSIEGIVE